MKKSFQTRRKHGLEARLGAAGAGPRLTTQVTFEKGSQSYLWLMDREASARRRSRLIKH